jgi:hypothetical protein
MFTAIQPMPKDWLEPGEEMWMRWYAHPKHVGTYIAYGILTWEDESGKKYEGDIRNRTIEIEIKQLKPLPSTEQEQPDDTLSRIFFASAAAVIVGTLVIYWRQRRRSVDATKEGTQPTLS